MSNTVIIFGSSKQDGFYLKNLFKEHNVISVKSPNSINGIDIRNKEHVENVISKYSPNIIINLASISSTSNDRFEEIYSTIYKGNENLLSILCEKKNNCKLILASSAYIYESSDDMLTLNSRFRYDNPYSLARINSLNCARYFSGRGVNSTTAHLFHHESKYRNSKSLLIETAIKMLDAKLTNKKLITFANTHITKEWTHAEDMMRAIEILAKGDSPKEINIATGIGLELKTVVNIFGRILNFTPPQICSLEKNCQPIKYVGDPREMSNLNWKPKITIEALCTEVLSSIKYDSVGISNNF